MNKAELNRRRCVAKRFKDAAIFRMHPAPNSPDPGQFGLTAPQVAFLGSTAEPSQLLPWALAWIGFFVICGSSIPVINWVFAGSKEQTAMRWWVLLAFYLSGAGIGFLIHRIKGGLVERRRLCHGNWPAYERYEEAVLEHENAWNVELDRKEHLRREEDRRRREQVDWWKSLGGHQFEKELAVLLSARGVPTRQRGGSADGGVDIEINQKGKRILVQCKSQKSYVSPGPVRDLYGTLLHEKAHEAWLVTTSGFSSGAREFAKGKPIRLRTIDEVLNDTSDP